MTYYGTMDRWNAMADVERSKYDLAIIFRTEEEYQDYLDNRQMGLGLDISSVTQDVVNREYYADWDSEPIGAPYHNW